MADYYVILKRAIGGLPDGSRERRQAIYDKARKALLTQLQNMDPPLAPSEISKQRMSLEEAVRSVERDLDLETREPSAEAEGENSPDSAPLGDAGLKTSAAVAEDNKAKEAVSSAPVVMANMPVSEAREPQKPTQPDDAKAVVVSPEPGTQASDKVVRRAGQDVLKNAVRDANALGAATNAAVKSAQDAADAVGEERDVDVARIEPTLGDSVVSRTKTYQRTDVNSDIPRSNDHGDGLGDDNEPKGRFGLIAGVLLLAGVVGGGGYLLYENRDAFVTSGNDNGEEVGSSSDQTSVDLQGAGQSDVGSEEIKSKPVRTVTVKSPDATDNSSQDTAGQTDAQTDAPDANENGTDSSVEEASNTVPSADANEASDAVASAPLRSILYEEESESGEPGSADAGEVQWTLEGEGDAAAIIITAQIPKQQVTFNVKIGKNVDPELPASHLIEISAVRETPDPKKAIVNIPGLILKPTEQSRGEGLVGAAMRIADDFHWIALTSGEKEVQYNLELLSLRSWIDIPIQYTSGRRGILTLEKGAAGERVVEDAIKAWGK